MSALAAFVKSIILISCCQQISASVVININDLIGRDEVTCGNLSNPCKTLDYVWNFTLPEIRNSTSVKFSFSPGVYVSNLRYTQTLFYDCNSGNISQIGFEVKKSNISRNNSDVVQMRYAFQTSSCILQFTGLNFQYPSNITTTEGSLVFTRCVFSNTSSTLQFVRSNVTFDHVVFSNTSTRESKILVWRSEETRFINCKFQNMRLANDAMFDFDTIGKLIIQNSSITNNVGLYKNTFGYYVSRRLISVKNSQRVWIENVTSSNNKNIIVSIEGNMGGQHSVGLKNVEITKSHNTTLLFDDVSITARNILIEHSQDEIQPFLSFRKSIVDLQNLQLQCVYSSKKNLEQSPIFVDSRSKVTCTNCTTLHCKNLCGEGYQTVQGVFCERCPNGTSAHDWEKKCFKCHPGYYAPRPGLSDCVPCKAGTFCKHRGCTSCQACSNDLFTSNEASPSCSQMSTFFIVMLGVTLLLIMTPIAIKMICHNKKKTNGNENEDEILDENEDGKYKRFENEKEVDIVKEGINNNDTMVES